MTQNLDALKDALLKPPSELLLALHELAQKAHREASDFARGLPRVRIDTQWSQHYEGRVLAVEVQAGRHRVLLAMDGGSQPALAYLELIEPFQITVFDAEDHKRLFRFGELTRWTDAEPPGALELRRIVQRFREWVKPAVGMELTVDDALIGQRGELNAIVRDVLNALAEYIDNTQRDKIADEAIKKIRALRVTHDPGHPLSVKRMNELLDVRFDPAEGLGERRDFFAELDSVL